MTRTIGGYTVKPYGENRWTGTLPQPDGATFIVGKNPGKTPGDPMWLNWRAHVPNSSHGGFGRTMSDAIDDLATYRRYLLNIDGVAQAEGKVDA